jgi:hypothetical protein
MMWMGLENELSEHFVTTRLMEVINKVEVGYRHVQIFHSQEQGEQWVTKRQDITVRVLKGRKERNSILGWYGLVESTQAGSCHMPYSGGA